jgi:UDP-N-acetylmuramyl pentapeptide phosphotransferase/UDP-N-acetylglucosamine-1-phosphate transferase
MLAALSVAFLTALMGGWLYLRWAPRRMLDLPNARSSHTLPTPRGGGLVIVGGFFIGLAVWLATGGSLSPRAIGWLVGALLVAAVSFVDDLRTLPAAPRLLTHLIGAALLTLGAAESGYMLVLPLAFVYVSLITNVYNFMDGIDGLAALQAIVAGVALALAGLVIVNPLVSTAGGLLAAASVGFLVYNLPPARLFMGDVGSTFLGFSLAGMTLLGSVGVGGGRLPIEFGFVVLAPFLFDSVVTLARRVLKGEQWYSAHRSHFYQRLVQSGLSHAQVTMLYTGLAIVAAAAGLAGLNADPPARATLDLLAYAPMLAVVALVWRLEGGAGPKQPNEPSPVVTHGRS